MIQRVGMTMGEGLSARVPMSLLLTLYRLYTL